MFEQERRRRADHPRWRGGVGCGQVRLTDPAEARTRCTLIWDPPPEVPADARAPVEPSADDELDRDSCDVGGQPLS